MFGRQCILLGLAFAGLSFAGFEPCKFNFGKGWTAGTNLSGVDFATIYAGDGGFNEFHHAVFIQETKAANVTPMLYGYIAAFMAREEGGLQDCDRGTPNLCQNGSAYIRNNRARIIDRYALYSQKIAAVWGANALVVWLIEPDLYQYSVSGSNQRKLLNGQEQSGGGIPDADIGKLVKDIATKIRQYMPNAQVSVDLSPWISNPTTYYANFDWTAINYVNTSGGRTEAATAKIRTADKMTWNNAHSITGKPILADCGYGVGGTKDGHHSEWDNATNIKARMANGVISINQFDAKNDWATSVLSSLRPQLTNSCPTGILTQNNKTKGTAISAFARNGMLQVEHIPQNALVEFVDLEGKIIYTIPSHSSNASVPVSQLRSGIYYIRAIFNNNTQTVAVPILE